MLNFPVYLVCGKQREVPMLLKCAFLPASLPLFNSVEFAGRFVVEIDAVEDSEIWRIESATTLKRWVDRVASHCECVPWDLSHYHGEWHTSGVTGFQDFLASVAERAASEQLACAN